MKRLCGTTESSCGAGLLGQFVVSTFVLLSWTVCHLTLTHIAPSPRSSLSHSLSLSYRISTMRLWIATKLSPSNITIVAKPPTSIPSTPPLPLQLNTRNQNSPPPSKLFASTSWLESFNYQLTITKNKNPWN